MLAKIDLGITALLQQFDKLIVAEMVSHTIGHGILRLCCPMSSHLQPSGARPENSIRNIVSHSATSTRDAKVEEEGCWCCIEFLHFLASSFVQPSLGLKGV